jgi:hypothetical protein
MLVVALAVAGTMSVWAAPVESVESARASASLQKVDAFLNEQPVVDQLTALGLSSEQARARLAQLSQTQLEQLAAQVDLIQAGGTIEGTDTPAKNPFVAIFRPLGTLLYNIFQVLFFWGDLK